MICKNSKKRKNKLIFIWIFLPIFFLLACQQERVRVLPIVGNYDIDYKMVNGKEVEDTIYPKIPDFKYLNQDSILIDSKNFNEKIKIFDFFFTTCPTICPPMTAQMKRLNIATKDIQEKLNYFSFTIDPKTDTPSVLKKHIQSNGIKAKNWNFLTGEEEETHALAYEFFHVGAQRNNQVDGGFYHTETFVLVDREGYVRGLYNGTDTKDVDRLEKDIRKLLKYEYGSK